MTDLIITAVNVPNEIAFVEIIKQFIFQVMHTSQKESIRISEFSGRPK
jgi:succinylglutamate desuccinylase